jgi:signal transduction histidine kinase
MKILVQAAVERGNGGLCGRDLTVVEEEIKRLEQSVQALLDFARPPQLAKSSVDVRTLVSQTVDLVSARAERQRAVLRCELPELPVKVEADGVQIRQVLLNLLLNALDSLSAGGMVVAKVIGADDTPPPTAEGDRELALRGLLPPRVILSGQRWCSIHVTDTGPGLPASLGDRIFEPFVSTKETGTGLGLPICRRIVEAHGGRIGAADRPQGGAEFIVWLPCTVSTIVNRRGEPQLISSAFQSGVP